MSSGCGEEVHRGGGGPEEEAAVVRGEPAASRPRLAEDEGRTAAGGSTEAAARTATIRGDVYTRKFTFDCAFDAKFWNFSV